MADEKKQTYQSVTLGLPPLKMVLLHTEDNDQPAATQSVLSEKMKEQLKKEQAVRKLIEHLNKKP